MQIFRCPFCGPRDETEFRFMGEAGKARPQGGHSVSAGDWASYLHTQRNKKGAVREIWSHMPCGELFAMTRDNVSHVVEASVSLRREQA